MYRSKSQIGEWISNTQFLQRAHLERKKAWETHEWSILEGRAFASKISSDSVKVQCAPSSTRTFSDIKSSLAGRPTITNSLIVVHLIQGSLIQGFLHTGTPSDQFEMSKYTEQIVTVGVLSSMLDQKLFIEWSDWEPTKHCIYSADKDRLKKLVLWKGGGRSGNGGEGKEERAAPRINDFCHWQKKRRRSGSQIFPPPSPPPPPLIILEYCRRPKKIDTVVAALAASSLEADQI